MRPIEDHNHFYLTEERKNQPKEYFRFLLQLAAEQLAAPSPRVLDIGCGAGDFLYYVRSLYPAASLCGIDLRPEFLAKAKQALPDADFCVGDISSGASVPADLFDVVFMSGVNYLFSDYEPWLRNIMSLTGQSAYIFGVFNPDDLDVRASVQRSGDGSSTTPWNLISQKSIRLFLDRLHMPHRFIDWELPIPSPRSHDDPLRSWTIETSDGRFLVINGMQIIHRLAVLQIDRGKSPNDHLLRQP